MLHESSKSWWNIPVFPRPFSFAQAPAEKLVDSFLWIDSNVHLKVEEVVRNARISDQVVPIVAQTVLTIFSLLLKMDDYALARGLNFNFSAFLQTRLIAFIFSEEVLVASERARIKARRNKAEWDNRIALQLLREWDQVSDLDLCRLGVAMGVVWVEQPELGGVVTSISSGIVDIAGNALSATRRLCIDHRRELLDALHGPQTGPIVVVLDDNGESVFDLALFQRLLETEPKLEVVFIVNQFPVSNNICFSVLEELLSDPFFSRLRGLRAEGRVEILVESQPFTSFEEHALSDQARSLLETARLAYIKGASFFETLQPTQIECFYLFTVASKTSVMLTGCREGDGVVARIPPHKAGYVVEGETIKTLVQIINNESKGNYHG
jgi:hypothetical protein